MAVDEELSALVMFKNESSEAETQGLSSHIGYLVRVRSFSLTAI